MIPRRFHWFPPALVAVILTVGPLQAQTYRTWDGSNVAQPDWDRSQNWSDNDQPDLSTEAARFNDNLLQAINVVADGSNSTGGILFDTGQTLAITFSGAGLLTISNTYGIINNSSALQTFDVGMIVGASQTWATGGAGMSFGSTVDLGANTLTLDATSTLTLVGVVSGTGGITKSGSGTAILSEANTYTGATVVSAGTLQISNAASLGGTGTGTSVASGATLALTGTGTTFNAEAVTLNGGTLSNAAGNNTWTGNIILGASSIINTATGTTLTQSTGVVSGSNNLSKTGAGNLILSGANTYSGTTTVSAGTLQISADGNLGSGTLSLNGGTLATNTSTALSSGRSISIGASGGTITPATSTQLTYGGTLTGSGTFTKAGPGSLVLSGANNHTGSTSITSGTLVAAHNNALGGTGGGTSVSSGGILGLQSGITITGESLNLASGGTLQNISGANAYANAITGTGNLQVASGTLTLSNNANAANVTVSDGGTLALTGGSTVTASGTVSLNGTGSGSTGALRNVSGNNVVDVVASGTFSLAGDTTISAAAGKLDLGDAGSGEDPFSIGANELTLDVATGATLQVNTQISGTGNVIKNGNGTVIYYMVGNAGHSGSVYVNNGEMQVDTIFDDNNGINGDLYIGDGSGAAGSAIFRLGQAPGGSSYNLINDSSDLFIFTDGLLDTRGYHELINNLTLDGGTVIGSSVLDRLDVAGDISSTSTSQAASISGLLGLNNTVNNISVSSGSSLNISAKISNGGFNKTGTGTLNLSGPNSFTDAVNINAGVVNVSSNFGLGNNTGSTTTVSSGAQLQLQGGITVANEDLVLNGAGIATDGALRSVSGNNTWSGSVNVASSSRIETVANTLTVSGAISSGGGTLTVAGAGNTIFSGTVGLGALVKEGTGTLTVSNGSVDSNVYSSTTINNGTFTLGGANEILVDSMDVTIGANGTFNVNTRTETIANLYGSGTLSIASGGALTVDELGNSGSKFTGTFDMAAGSTLTLNSGVIGTGASGVGAAGTMIVAGSGTLQITDDFRFDGTLEMSTGTLLLTNTGTTFDLGTLHITGNSVLDFTDADITTLNLGELVIDMGATISVVGWTYDVDFWSSDIWSSATRDYQGDDPTTRVTFNGYTNLQTIWLTEGDEITVPEPSTYGAILIGSGLAVFLWRRQRRAKTSSVAAGTTV